MPAYGVEVLRHQTELNEVGERIRVLLQQLDPEDVPAIGAELGGDKPKTRIKKVVTKRASALDRHVAEDAADDIRENLEELLAALHLEERERMLSQVVDWFVSHTPNAMKDIAVLERADKECVQRECERAWAALGTEDRLRKKERNTVRQVQQFIYSLAREHRAGCLARDGDDESEESLVGFDERLLALSDEQLALEVEELGKKIQRKEEDVVRIFLSIAERGRFLTDQRIEHLREHFTILDASHALDLVAEQEKLWMAAEEELHRLESQKDLIYEVIGFVKGRIKGDDNARLHVPEHLADLLARKRGDVESKHGPALLAKRIEDYGKDLEKPNMDNLSRLQAENAELNSRIQRAAVIKPRLAADACIVQDFERSLAMLREGAAPSVAMLVQLAEVVDPSKDWSTEAQQDEDPRRSKMEAERLGRKKNEVLTLVNRMMEEQLAYQKEFAEQYAASKSADTGMHHQEHLVTAAKDALALLQEHHELTVATLACARSNISPLAGLHLRSNSRPAASRGSGRWAPRRSVLSEADDDGGSSSSSFAVGSVASKPPSSRNSVVAQRKRSLVEPGDPSAWSAEAVVAEGVGELLNSRPFGGTWVGVFEEDASGRIRKGAIAAQTALMSQLQKEQSFLRSEVEDMEKQVLERMKLARKSIASGVRSEEQLKRSHDRAAVAVRDLDRHIQALLGVEAEPSPGQGPAFSVRKSQVEHCRSTVESLDGAEIPPLLQSVHEALRLEEGNDAVMRQIADLAPETEKNRAQWLRFKQSLERSKRLSSQQRSDIQERWRNRELRQSCRDLHVAREAARAEHAAIDVSKSFSQRDGSFSP